MPPLPQPGGGGDGGSSGPTGSSGGSSGSGDVGSFPGGSEDPLGVPPPPSASGGGDGGMAGEASDAAGSSGSGEGESDPSEWEEESTSQSENECGDNGALPGGIGGMGQDGECIGGGAAAADSSNAASASGGGGASGGAGGGSAGGGGGGAAAGNVQGTGGAGGVGEFPGESDAERAARLGQELEESLGGFDETLQEEQDEIAAVGRSTDGFDTGGQGSGGGGISLGEQSGGGAAGGGGGNASGGPIAVANSRVARESPIAGMSQEEIRERTPEDIPVLVDDDIIARQLREAALAEEDPVLRERLWEEYRKYSGM